MILLISFIILLFTTITAQEFTLTNVSPDFLIKYPTILETSCSIGLFILVENITMPINVLFNDDPGYGFLKVDETDHSVLFKSFFNNIIGKKNFTLTVNNNITGNGFLTVPLNCAFIDVQSITVDIIQSVFWDNVNKYSCFVRLNGVPDGSIQLTPYDTSLYKLSLVGNSVYHISFLEKYYLKKTKQDLMWDMIIKFPNNQEYKLLIPYNITETPNNNNNDEIIEFQKYPNASSFEFASIVFGAMITYKSKSTFQTPIFSLFKEPEIYLIPVPISGNNINGITYIAACIPFSQPQTFKIYRKLINSSYIDDNAFSFNSSISPNLIPSDFKVGNVIFNDNSTNVPLISICSNFTTKYDFKIIKYTSKNSNFGSNYGFPFGFIDGNNLKYQTIISIPVTQSSQKTSFEFNSRFKGSITSVTTFYPSKTVTFSANGFPKIISFNSTYIGQFKFLVRFHLTDNSGIKFLSTIVDNQYFLWDNEYLVSGNIFNGVWQFIYSGVLYGQSGNIFQIQNFLDYELNFDQNTPFSASEPYNRVMLPSIYGRSNLNYLKHIKDISFLYNNINITNQSVDNIIYFTFNNIEQYKNISIGFMLNDPKTLADYNFYNTPFPHFYPNYQFAEWDEINGRFSVRFRIPANTVPGILDYRLVFSKFGSICSTILPDKYQLKVISENIDIYGPIITKIIKYTSNTIGWLITIEDETNGFDHGIFTIRGSIDSSLYNISLKLSDAIVGGNKWKSDYLISIPLNTSRCFSQEYIIVYASLTDSFKNVNNYFKYLETDTFINSVDSTRNPFRNFLNDTSVYSVLVGTDICSSIDSSPPILIKFDLLVDNTTGMDVGLRDRYIRFGFEAQDLDSGLKEGQSPIIYLLGQEMKSVECVSTEVSRSKYNCIYTCLIQVPLGFGVGSGGFLISVYGFINNGGYYSGFSSQQLKSLGFGYWVPVSPSNYTLEIPIIKESSSISNFGGDLWLYGRGFDSIDTIIISYKNEDVKSAITDRGGVIYGSALLVKNLKPTNDTIMILLYSSIEPSIQSNEFIIEPNLYYFNYSGSLVPPITTPTVIPTKSPIPTNPPQICKGNPECGGPNNGFCTDKGCQCILPWVGNDCTSTVISVDPPVKNNTDPTTEITIPGSSGGSTITSSETIFKSLISIVSLRELDYNGVALKTFPLGQWRFLEINGSISKYETIVTVDQDSEQVKILITLQWFTESKKVYFAGQTLQMNPSSIKYYVEINKYPFSQSLNKLQLVMSATLLSLNGDGRDICSLKEFADTSSGDDSNFLKLQIDNHSVYGRFIKRAIVDDLIVSVENILLDDSLEVTNSNSITQSFIGISIPFFNNKIIIDPDFSVLLDSKSISQDTENSICFKNNLSSSGLTTSQLAGIIIGAVVIFISIVGAFIFILYKKRKHKLILLSLKEIVLMKKNKNNKFN